MDDEERVVAPRNADRSQGAAGGQKELGQAVSGNFGVLGMIPRGNWAGKGKLIANCQNQWIGPIITLGACLIQGITAVFLILYSAILVEDLEV